MKRLEDIPKKNIFETPEGYFDKLPGIIQSRIAEKEKSPSTIGSFGLVLRYAIPVFAIAMALFLVFRQSDPMTNPDELLASVSSEELTYFLVESDFSTDELLDVIDLNEVDIDALNAEMLSPDFDSELLEEFADDMQLEL